jgi:hypothetical protein
MNMDDQEIMMVQEGHETVMSVMVELEHEMMCFADNRGGNVSAYEVKAELLRLLEEEMR